MSWLGAALPKRYGRRSHARARKFTREPRASLVDAWHVPRKRGASSPCDRSHRNSQPCEAMTPRPPPNSPERGIKLSAMPAGSLHQEEERGGGGGAPAHRDSANQLVKKDTGADEHAGQGHRQEVKSP
ncbi:hypothetical protein AAFF_G00019480 [Aldrovandia affinis]|uniref:Uncharacterized protein n=1 Tax=Aldrovandia affinis TaxID=143900 RepID=A0AAD7WGL7_9TELE|nr:hypothetical protein AAFF_G00019480 [Aldrovandia affinis]